MLGVICFHYQCGCGPLKCCDYDNDGMCWGCVCCTCQIDPCFIPRNCLKCVCLAVPCGCIAEETILVFCCCNPDKETRDKRESDKAALREQNAKK